MTRAGWRESAVMSSAQAEAVYDALVREAGADERHRTAFVHAQTTSHVDEWRFMGALGFGGKFWRNSGRRADGSWGEVWYVNYYAENKSPEREKMVERATAAVEAIRNAPRET